MSGDAEEIAPAVGIRASKREAIREAVAVPIWLSFLAGILGMLVILVLACIVGHPTRMLMIVMVVILAFSAACALTGFLGSMTVTSGAIRAGGAAAIFVFVVVVCVAF